MRKQDFFSAETKQKAIRAHGPAFQVKNEKNLSSFSSPASWITLALGMTAFNAVFAKAFQSLICKNGGPLQVMLRLWCSALVVLFFDNWFEIRFLQIPVCGKYFFHAIYLHFSSFLVYPRFTHIQYVPFQTYHVTILHKRKYKPLHTPHINKHTRYTQ